MPVLWKKGLREEGMGRGGREGDGEKNHPLWSSSSNHYLHAPFPDQAAARNAFWLWAGGKHAIPCVSVCVWVGKELIKNLCEV